MTAVRVPGANARARADRYKATSTANRSAFRFAVGPDKQYDNLGKILVSAEHLLSLDALLQGALELFNHIRLQNQANIFLSAGLLTLLN